jgi:hypothetical protein
MINMGTELYDRNTLNIYLLRSVNVLCFICFPIEKVIPAVERVREVSLRNFLERRWYYLCFIIEYNSVTCKILTVCTCRPFAQSLSRNVNPCRLPTTVYLIYSKLSSTFECGVFHSKQKEDIYASSRIILKWVIIK